MSLVETEGLTKDFGGLRAVHDLALRVEEGEIVGLIGPNGSGKTTCFNLITGLYQGEDRRIRVGPGRRGVRGPGPHRITALGIARTFQNQRLFDHMTVLENVLVGMHCRTRSGIASILLGLPWSRKEHRRAKARAAELLGLFGDRLLPRAARPAWTLSYANRRRLEIARGLAAKPRLLLLDEPAAGMNPTQTRGPMRHIRRNPQAGPPTDASSSKATGSTACRPRSSSVAGSHWSPRLAGSSPA